MQNSSKIKFYFHLVVVAGLTGMVFSGCSQDNSREKVSEVNTQSPQMLDRESSSGSQLGKDKSTGTNPDEDEKQVTVSVDRGVKRLVSGTCTGEVARHEKMIEVIEDADTYRRAVEGVGGRLGEFVDFENYIVVGAYSGPQSHCGTEVLIFGPKMLESGEQLIEFGVTETEYTCIHKAVDDAESHPYAFAKFPRLKQGLSYTLRERTIPSCLE